MIYWLVVWTILKNISQWEGLSHILWKINNVWNHPHDLPHGEGNTISSNLRCFEDVRSHPLAESVTAPFRTTCDLGMTSRYPQSYLRDIHMHPLLSLGITGFMSFESLFESMRRSPCRKIWRKKSMFSCWASRFAWWTSCSVPIFIGIPIPDGQITRRIHGHFTLFRTPITGIWALELTPLPEGSKAELLGGFGDLCTHQYVWDIPDIPSGSFTYHLVI